jgi:UDP-glucuronate 4-epimerase
MNTTANDIKNTRVLVTGAAGFIGFRFIQKLLAEGYDVIGIDVINDYYDVNLKRDRLVELGFPKNLTEVILKTLTEIPYGSKEFPQLTFYRADLKERDRIAEIFDEEKPDYVVHLAAQAGVRFSLRNPYAYMDSNINGFMNILENCRHHEIKHLTFASSSSVYGANEAMPFSEQQNVDHPVSLYAATKKSNELMAHCYSHLYKIPVTGLRFFTVYGPWGRPDMAYFSFTRNILENKPINVFNHGDMKRDFTYIDDIVEGICRVMQKIPEANEEWDGLNPDPSSSRAPYRIFNIGNNQPVQLLYFIELLEKSLGKKAQKNLMPFQKGDVKETFADISALSEYTGFSPSTTIEEGIPRFVEWYLDYYGV